MGAILEIYEAVLQTLKAGRDLILICHDQPIERVDIQGINENIGEVLEAFKQGKEPFSKGSFWYYMVSCPGIKASTRPRISAPMMAPKTPTLNPSTINPVT